MPSMLQILFLLPLAAAQIDPEFPNHCPEDPKTISPCTCQPEYDGSCFIKCYAVKIGALNKLAQYPNLCNGQISFSLIHSKVPGIPTALWKMLLGSKSVDVAVMYSNVEYVVPPGDEPLPALSTPGSAIIKVVHSKDISRWKWSHFKTFDAKYKLTLVIDDTPVDEITSDFSEIAGGNMRKVAIDRTGLKSLPDDIFSRFEKAYSISIQDNELTEVKRSMFPRPATNLRFLSLNGNYLSDLPSDIFTDMPALEIVYLRENELTTLPNDIFKPISSRNLRVIDLLSNPWECDCDLAQATSEFAQKLDMGYCATPADMIGTKVNEVSKVLEC